MNIKDKSLFFLTIGLILSAAAWIELLNTTIINHFIQSSFKWQFLLAGLGGIVFIHFGFLVCYLFPTSKHNPRALFSKLRAIQLPTPISTILVIIISLIYPLLIYSANGRFIDGLFIRLFLLWIGAVIGALAIGDKHKVSFLFRMIFMFSFASLAYVLYSFQKSISTSPFTLSWSEASRYYYASLFRAQHLYGKTMAWSFLHPSRYLLQSIPFFIGDFPIVVHRIWQVFLWISMPLLTIWIFLKRIITIKGFGTWMFVIWSFLFLYQGPVYYHLLVCVWLVLLGYDKENHWKTGLFVVLASLWAGISRINWFPVPAMIAITLYLLDHPFPGKKKFFSYFSTPLLFTIFGIASAFGAQIGYAYLSGESQISSFGSSFTSDLLWYRLWPNSTSEWGIVIPVLLLTLPLIVLLVVNLSRQAYHYWQIGPIVAIVLVLFAGGLVVSTKIGGGGNLHNLDAWLVVLWIIAGKTIFQEQALSTLKNDIVWKPSWLMIVLFVLPIVYNIDINRSYASMIPANIDLELEQEELDSILRRATEASDQGEEVLFISQRQLLMFEENDIPLTEDYELLILMEMAISKNQLYLEKFRTDLQKHRFGIIVVEKQVEKISTREDGYFSEENNAWVESITISILENYTEIRYYPYSNVSILIPKD